MINQSTCQILKKIAKYHEREPKKYMKTNQLQTK